MMERDRLCTIDGCGKTKRTKGLCDTHYARLHKFGTTDIVEVRFWRWVNKSESGCWNWTGHKNPGGYGWFTPGKDVGVGPLAAHRWSYRMHVDEIPDGLTIDHLCRNRACVNPDHLEPVTLAENIRRGTSPSAKHAAKTHCKWGHPFSGENLRIDNLGRRLCVTCRRRRERERRQRVG